MVVANVISPRRCEGVYDLLAYLHMLVVFLRLVE
uniref:Uncharacterized protein n=1 Tax=Coprothermobacter proteolyticus (strain ATCC 35245 / DSM 5265 / OCM 4 / BT) TaxID=309798 RepID=B5Y782_COPPD